jgi:teichuronic acid biosynthesis glycosyltransferase TuaC
MDGADAAESGGLGDRTLLVITPDFPDEANRYIGGVFVKNQLEPIRKAFGRVVVIAPVPLSGGRVASDRFCRDYRYGNVEVHFPRALFVPRRLRLPLIERAKPYLDLRARAVERLVRSQGIRFDLVHAHFTWPSGHIARRLKETNGVPSVLTVHEDSGWLAEEAAAAHPLVVGAWRAQDAIVRVNRRDVPLLERYNPHVLSIPNGYPPEFRPMDRDDCRRRLGFPLDTKILFSLGYLVEQKGFAYLVEAMRLVADARDDVLCCIGGSGPLRGELQGRIDELGLSDRVRLLGFVEDALVPVWMNAADLFVMSSLNEGNPTVMFEALGCARPFVGTRVGGIPEIIDSDDYGLLVDPADPDGLADAIRAGLDREWEIDRIREYGRQFSWEAIGRRLLEVYARLLDEADTSSKTVASSPVRTR